MSLRAFHITFIFLSIALLLGFAWWQCRVNANLPGGVLSAVSAVLLAVYLIGFILKMKKGGS